MSLLYRALKKAEAKDKSPDADSSPQLLAEGGGDGPRRGVSGKTLLGLLLVLSVAAIGGVLYWPEIENLLVPRAVSVASSVAPVTPVASVASAGPTAEERAAEASRLAEEQRLAEENRLAEEARLADDARRAEEARLAEEQRLAEINAQQQADMAARLAEEQRKLDEIGAAAQTELALIADALEEARREREALGVAQQLAREQTAAAAAAARDMEQSTKATLAALRDEIAKQQAVLEQISAAASSPAPSPTPSPTPSATPSATIETPEPMPQTVSETSPPPESPSAVAGSNGELDVNALVIRQAGESAPRALGGPITIERPGDVKQGVLAGLMTVIDESDYFRDRYDAALRSLNAGGARSALAIYDELLERQPRDRVALLGKATALHRLNRPGDAINAYEAVLRHYPDEIAALTNLLGLIGVQTPESALKQLRRLYTNNPGFGAVAAQMAMIHLQLGDSANAIRLMSEAAALALDNPIYWINLAIMHDRVGDSQTAISAYEHALLVAGGSAEALPLSVDAIRERLRYLRSN